MKIYQKTLSPFTGKQCRFYPTCSEYGIQAVRKHGTFMGLWLTIKRVAKCGPWHPGGVDEVP